MTLQQIKEKIEELIKQETDTLNKLNPLIHVSLASQLTGSIEAYRNVLGMLNRYK